MVPSHGSLQESSVTHAPAAKTIEEHLQEFLPVQLPAAEEKVDLVPQHEPSPVQAPAAMTPPAL